MLIIVTWAYVTARFKHIPLEQVVCQYGEASVDDYDDAFASESLSRAFFGIDKPALRRKMRSPRGDQSKTGNFGFQRSTFFVDGEIWRSPAAD